LSSLSYNNDFNLLALRSALSSSRRRPIGKETFFASLIAIRACHQSMFQSFPFFLARYMLQAFLEYGVTWGSRTVNSFSTDNVNISHDTHANNPVPTISVWKSTSDVLLVLDDNHHAKTLLSPLIKSNSQRACR